MDKVVLSAILLLHLAAFACGAPFKNLILNLPGLEEKAPFRAFSGYLKSTGTRNLFYWFVESQNDPQNDPLVLWFNGGPGCSSMEGMLHEHGPYQIQPDGKTIKLNPYSWNKVANVLYIEAPAGVGYSYSLDENYVTGDAETALANYIAVKDFFRQFPEYAHHEFYISGESYAGVYVPSLAAQVAADPAIKFKGIAVGNGLSSYDINDNSAIYFMYYHGFLGGDMWKTLKASCCPKDSAKRCDFKNGARSSPICRKVYEEVSYQVWMSGVNPYNVMASCAGGVSTYSNDGSASTLRHTSLFFDDSRLRLARGNFSAAFANDDEGVSPPCTDGSDLLKYLNSQPVRAALHVSSRVKKWNFCSSTIGQTYRHEFQEMDDFYHILLAKKIRILVYNGDLDLACNFLGDQWFVNRLQAPLKNAKRPWLVVDEQGQNQIAGFVKDFEGISYMTVKGAGHMVPTDKPYESLEMLKRFLKDGVY